jgi:hypothetical protein
MTRGSSTVAISRMRPPQRGQASTGASAAAPAGMGGEDPVVEHEIDPGARDQGGELFQELFINSCWMTQLPMPDQNLQ